jgi:hypothetical protein
LNYFERGGDLDGAFFNGSENSMEIINGIK